MGSVLDGVLAAYGIEMLDPSNPDHQLDSAGYSADDVVRIHPEAYAYLDKWSPMGSQGGFLGQLMQSVENNYELRQEMRWLLDHDEFPDADHLRRRHPALYEKVQELMREAEADLAALPANVRANVENICSIIDMSMDEVILADYAVEADHGTKTAPTFEGQSAAGEAAQTR